MKSLPFNIEDVRRWAEDYPTPFYVYDEKGIRDTVTALKEAFSWSEGFREYFAVKATPTPAVLRLLSDLGCGFDCASVPEIMLARCSGAEGHGIILSSNETSRTEYKAAYDAGAIINLDDYTQIENLERSIGCIPDTICLRFNPGAFGTSNDIIGHLYDSKFGMTEEQLMAAISVLKEKGVREFGVHAMLSSCSLNEDYYPSLAEELFSLAVRIKESQGVSLSFIDMSGGIGIPYRPEEKPVDIRAVGAEVKKVYDRLLVPEGIKPAIFTELGRFITGPHGYLLTSVIGKKHIYKEYIGVDATASCLMRPAIYGSYHHITVPGRENSPSAGTFDVVGSLCENNDKFAIDRELPELSEGDIIVIHDAGAHGHSMGYTYNGKLRPAELMLMEDRKLKLIRRAQTVDDYFATLDCDNDFIDARSRL